MSPPTKKKKQKRAEDWQKRLLDDINTINSASGTGSETESVSSIPEVISRDIDLVETINTSPSSRSTVPPSDLDTLMQEIIQADLEIIENHTQKNHESKKVNRNKKPPGYWKSWDNFVNELTLFIKCS